MLTTRKVFISCRHEDTDIIVVDSTQALTSTSYIGLGVLWRNAGASAQFSNFQDTASA